MGIDIGIYVTQRKDRRWPHATPALNVASDEANGLLQLVLLSTLLTGRLVAVHGLFENSYESA